MSSNILVGAAGEGQPPTTTTTTPQTSLPARPELLVQNIAQSTSQMAQYAAQLNANAQQQQRVPGVEYTLNPTARAFAPSSPEETSAE